MGHGGRPTGASLDAAWEPNKIACLNKSSDFGDDRGL
jgi:hypothetical protein